MTAGIAADATSLPVRTVPVQAFAAAKVNLALAVTGRRDDGYHTLDTLVAFADVGDRLELEQADRLSLDVSGPFGRSLTRDADNIVLRAARAHLSRSDAPDPVRLRLDKVLPVASGMGGGSADAAAALRLLNAASRAPLGEDALSAIALSLGADVPMCLRGRPVRATGIGDILDRVALPTLHAVLVNPLVAVPTQAVFAALASRGNAPLDAPPAKECADTWLDWLADQRNDLERPALQVAPVIAEVLDALARNDAAVVRMSGSGATCFGLYPTAAAAARAGGRLQDARPGWWVRACLLGHAPEDRT